MTRWNFCPECKKNLAPGNDGNPSCPDGHFTKYPTPVATTIGLIENNGKYLIIKRSHEPQKGKWDLTGGFMEPGEQGLESLLREIKEETKLKVKPKRYLGAFPSTYGVTEVATLATAYELVADNRDVKLSEESSEYKWINLNSIPELAFADCKQAVEALRKKQN